MKTVAIKNQGAFKVKTNTRLLDCFIKNNVPIMAICNGNGRCGACRVKITPMKKSLNKLERLLIPQNMIKKGFRLACQYKITGNIKVHTPKIKKVRKTSEKINCGLALDIGTTVIKGAAVNLITGDIERITRVYNDQNSIGGDVLSRVGAALGGKYNLQRKLLFTSIDRLKAILGIQNPVITVVVGNPVMLAFYLRKSVKGFAHYPFTGDITTGSILQKPLRYISPVIGGFVGGDTVSGLMASRLYHTKNQNNLYIDLGTNGEVVLIRRKKIYATSTAAGPAFEGIGISSGCLAIPGAIDSVTYSKGKMNYQTINRKKPVGICASGFFNLLKLLLEQNLLNANGRLDHDIKVSSLTINQTDIRKLQLAIGAIHCGVKILLQKAKVKPNSLDRAIITGEFGSKLDTRVLKRIGLLPEGIRNVVFQRDLPLLGAIEVIKNSSSFSELEVLRQHSSHVDLAMQPDFQDIFISSLRLAPWN